MGGQRTNCHIIIIFSFVTVVSAMAQLAGTLEPCQNEGHQVVVDSIDKYKCYSCFCKNGYVECKNNCPRIDNCYLAEDPGSGCCQKCKGCMYQGIYHQSHTEWKSPDDPCKILRCLAGVVTVSDLQCHTPCPNPLPPEPGKCCPRCPECSVNGQVASDDREIVISTDPCLKCRCDKSGSLTCAKLACPVLQCPPHRQHHIPGECCSSCLGTRAMFSVQKTCVLQSTVMKDGGTFSPEDKCTNCVCRNETSVCHRPTCPVLHCPPEDQRIEIGSCCKRCAPSDGKNHCVHRGKIYEEGQQWKVSQCESCQCSQGQARCAITKCSNVTCPEGTRPVPTLGDCCKKCVEIVSNCMVYGNLHYKTFDGKQYDLNGIGKYQMVADCANNTFSIRVANSVRNTPMIYSKTPGGFTSFFTKRVAIKFGDVRLNLQQRGRIKYNGRKINAPFKEDGKFRIEKRRENVELILNNGVRVFWNGRSLVDVTVPPSYKNKLCGLCGNYNSNTMDDLTTRQGKVVTNKEISAFRLSWCIGKNADCEKKIKLTELRNLPFQKKLCTVFRKDSSVFSKCSYDYSKYHRTCLVDYSSCPKGKCYCDSFQAYVRDCERRLGITIPSKWQKQTACDLSSMRKPKVTPRRTYLNWDYSIVPIKKLNITRKSASNPIPII